MSEAKDRAKEMKRKLEEERQANSGGADPTGADSGAVSKGAEPRDPRGRKKSVDSKRSKLASGELSKMSVLIPAEIHTELAVMAAKDKTRDMSDIVTEILQKNIKLPEDTKEK